MAVLFYYKISLAQLFPHLVDQPCQQASSEPEPPTEPIIADLSEPPIFTNVIFKGFRHYNDGKHTDSVYMKCTLINDLSALADSPSKISKLSSLLLIPVNQNLLS